MSQSLDGGVVNLAFGDLIEQRLGDRVVPSLGWELLELLAEPHRQHAAPNAREVASSATSNQSFAQVIHQAEAESPVVVCQRGAVEAHLLTPGGGGEVGTITRGYLLEWRNAELQNVVCSVALEVKPL